MKPKKIDTVLNDKQEIKEEIKLEVKEENIVEKEKLEGLNMLKGLQVIDEDDDFDFPSDNDYKEPKSEILTSEDYHKEWCKLVVDFTDNEPILAMCCSKAIKFDVNGLTLNVGFEYDTNMLLLDDEVNKKIISDKLFEKDKKLDLKFYVIEKPVDETQEKIDRIKALFDSKILKITKK